MWGQCPQSWEHAYVDGIKRKGSKTFFDLGNYFHELSHVYYQLLEQGRQAGDKFTQDYISSRIRRDLANVTGDNIEIMNRVMKMMTRFVREQSPKIDSGITVLGVELHLEVPYTTPKGREVILQGFIDLIYRDRAGRIRIRDHKTGARNSWNQRKLEMLPQLITYLVMITDFTEYQPTAGEISFVNSYDYKKKEPTADELFSLFRNTYSKVVIDNFRQHLLTTMDRILDQQPGEAYKNYSGDCVSCQYFDICSLSLRGADTKPIIAQRYEKVERNYGNSIAGVTPQKENPDENPIGDQTRSESNSFVLRWNGNGIGN